MKRFAVLVVIAIFVLVGCGGGGSDGGSSNVSSPAEGLWRGTTNTNRDIAGAVLDDGTYWLIYSSVGNSTVIAGVVQGNSSSSSGSFSSDNGKDFNLEGSGINNITVAGTYTAKTSLAGTVTYSLGGSTGTFNSSYDNNYDLTPSLAAIAGTYSGDAATYSGWEAATVIISSVGAISGNGASGCSFTGSATPRAKGNVYNVSVTFGGGVCTSGTSTVTGVAYFDTITKQITSAALNSGRTDGFLYVGTKP